MQNVIQHPQVAPSVPEPQTTPVISAAIGIPQTAGPEGRCREVHRVAGELFQRSPDWVTFFREVLGVEGAARRIFPSSDEFMQFEQTQEYNEIQQMVAKLRENSRSQAQGTEPTRVITVRLPKSLHESLRTEAHERRTSMNKLCISKLLQVIDWDLIPHE
ncbi:MAG: hypothetical protein CMJ81_17825 [Planctomycetaceae bacterium]|nr:hypothetical protein [Planctomycetaceae bacterium]